MLLFSLTSHGSERSAIPLRLWKPDTYWPATVKASPASKGKRFFPSAQHLQADTWGTGSHSGPLNKRKKPVNCIKFSRESPWLSGLVHSPCVAEGAELDQPGWRRERRGGSCGSLYKSSGGLQGKWRQTLLGGAPWKEQEQQYELYQRKLQLDIRDKNSPWE